MEELKQAYETFQRIKDIKREQEMILLPPDNTSNNIDAISDDKKDCSSHDRSKLNEEKGKKNGECQKEKRRLNHG